MSADMDNRTWWESFPPDIRAQMTECFGKAAIAQFLARPSHLKLVWINPDLAAAPDHPRANSGRGK